MSKKTEAINLTNKAYHAVESGDFQTAKRLLEQALKIDDSIPDTHAEYALVLTRIGKADDARDYLLKAVELAPHNPKFWINLSFWYFQKGDLKTALKCVFSAEEADPAYPTIEVARMNIAHAMGASENTIRQHRKQAQDLYAKWGTRADGTPLQPGELERFLSIK